MPINDFELDFTEGVQGPIIATAQANHVFDAGAARGRDWGSGYVWYKPWLMVRVAFNNLTSLTVDIIAADANDGTGNPVILSTSGAVLLASLTLNKNIILPSLAPGSPRRFLVGKFTVAGIAPTTGSCRLVLAPNDALPQDNVLQF